MAIKFVKDYSVGTPPETFKVGDVVRDRDLRSEQHFVSRNVAGFLGDDGKLTNLAGDEIADPTKPVRRAPVAAAAVSDPLKASSAPPPGAVLSGKDVKSTAAGK